MKHFMMSMVFALGFTCVAQAEIYTEEIDYSVDGVQMKGFLAYDPAEADDPVPGVLVVHEWWGHNDYARKRAKMLAEEGYIAFAVDMYGDGKKAEHPDDAGAFATEVKSNLPAARKRFEEALKLLRNHSNCDEETVMAIGYCFGGGVVLQMAREGVDLAGVVSFHGSLDTDHPAEKGKGTAKVLVCHGGDDPFVAKEAVGAFEQEMDDAGISYSVKIYEGAKHSFTNPEADAFGKKFNLPLEYNKEADEASWQDMLSFFTTLY